MFHGYKHSLALWKTCYQKQLIFLTLWFWLQPQVKIQGLLKLAVVFHSSFLFQRNGFLLEPNKDIFFSIGFGRMLVSGNFPKLRKTWLITHARKKKKKKVLIVGQYTTMKSLIPGPFKEWLRLGVVQLEDAWKNLQAFFSKLYFSAPIWEVEGEVELDVSSLLILWKLTAKN